MTGRADLFDVHPDAAALARGQADTITREQLAALGVRPHHVEVHLNQRRWREVVPGVLVTHCGPLPRTTGRWVAVLAGGPTAALGSWTALDVAGLSGWDRPADHLVVPRGRHVPMLAGVVVHESRRHTRADIEYAEGLPVHGVARAAVDTASWSRDLRTATGLLAAVVQQGLTTPERLELALTCAGRVRRRRQLALALADIRGGAQALSEIDLVRLCRRFGLPARRQQRMRRDVQGRRRYLDAEWTLPGGRVLVLEIDGMGHLDPRRWYADLLREAELELPRDHRVIRLPATAARQEPHRVAAILARALRT